MCADPVPETLASRTVFTGRLINVRVDEVRLPDGPVAAREVVEHPGAIVVAALDEQRRVALVRQYRHAVGSYLLELPAGTLEPGEEPQTTAERELEEETGLTARTWEYLGSFFSSPGFLREQLHAYLARDLEQGASNPDDDEAIETMWVELENLFEEPGKIKDAKTLATLLLIRSRLEAREDTRPNLSAKPGSKDPASGEGE